MASEIKVDTISEKTSANGVTIDGVSLKDSKIATANSVDSDAYVDGSIDAVHLSANSVDSDAYVDGSIDEVHMSANSIDSDSYVDASIDNAHLADNAVDTAEIADNAVTLDKMAGLARGTLIYGDASGDPAALAAGGADEVLTHDGTDLAWAAAGGGGITAASQWRLTTSFAGTADPIDSNWEEVDEPVGFGILGSSMTESSGIFTFPSTGYWLINFSAIHMAVAGQAARYAHNSIQTTTDNSTYASAAADYAHISDEGAYNYIGTHTRYIFDVVSTSLCKVRFKTSSTNANVNTTGNSTADWTGVMFTRLGDT